MTKTERQLHADGYSFTGIYSSRDKEEIKARAADLRKQGIPAKVLTKTYESRGGSTIGWSVYIKKPATPPAKARPETVDFYWPQIKQAKQAKSKREALEQLAKEYAGDLWDATQDVAPALTVLTMAEHLLQLHDAGLITIAAVSKNASIQMGAAT